MTQTVTAADPQCLRVAVAGNPNSGKTTIFNGLTGMRLKVGNYAGVTVECRQGRLRNDPTGRTLLIDMPGTYSLAARSLDERIARDVLLGWQPGQAPPDAVIVVLDAANLQRNLYLATQILELNLPVIFLCNMMDIARRRGLTINLSRFAETFGVPVVPTIGNRAEGLDQIGQILRQIMEHPDGHRPACPLPEPIEHHAILLGQVLARHGLATDRTARGAALLLLLRPAQVEHGIDEPLPAEVDRALRDARADLGRAGFEDVPGLLVQRRYEWLDERLVGVVRKPSTHRRTRSDRIDRVLTHKYLGMVLFAGIMFGMFAATFWLAEPLMGLVERLVTFLQAEVHAYLPTGALADLLADGVVAGVGNVVVFFPQICLLFLFISLLEDSGYMARAAFLMDRIMRRVGLHGKSFIPLLSSMACTVPGIMATRTIESRRDRLATILVAPLISCSARLPVYFVLIALIFPRQQTWTKACVLASIYLAGILAALGVATILKKTLLRGPTPMFIMELPPYRLPAPLPVLRAIWDRGRSFLLRAGTFILAASVVLWAILYWPRPADLAAVPETHEILSQALAAQGPEPGDIRGAAAAPFAGVPAPKKGEVSAAGAAPAPLSPSTSPRQPAMRSRCLAKQGQPGSVGATGGLPASATTAVTQHSALITHHSILSPESAAARQLEYSLAGRLGKIFEPVVRPLGFDWRIGVGIIASFAGREVFVSTMGIVYSVDDAENGQGALRARMQSAVASDGRPVFYRATCLSLLVFYALAMQCISTLAVAYREAGSWRWPAFMWAYMTLLAYGAAWMTYHAAAALGLAT